MPSREYQHWKIKQTADGFLWLGIDRADSATNSLNYPVLEELNDIVDKLPAQAPQGMVIYSCKESGFISGADVEQFSQFNDVNKAVDLIRQVQQIFDKLEAFSFPTVALINGFCLGGGLELALACDYRIASLQHQVRIGLPEVMLGIHPGWGGTIRLPRLIGPSAAITLMLSGRPISAKKAKLMGVIDDAVPERQLNNSALYYLQNKPAKQKASFWQNTLNWSFIRPVVASLIRKKLNAKDVKIEHYPAPYAIVENWLTHGIYSEKSYIAEANSVGKLLMTDTAINLSRVYFLQERLKNLDDLIVFEAQHVHVIGAGVMGGDIATWCALKGYRVTLQDRHTQYIAPAVKRAHKLFTRKLTDPLKIRDAMDRLQADVAGDGIRKADVIIEAVSEDVALKQALFKDIEEKAKPTALLATNTSSIMLKEISAMMQQPERLVGIHFFNPVHKMPLVEVVYNPRTFDTEKQHAIAFVRTLRRLPLPVKSAPGFLVNRVLAAYLFEAFLIANEGVPMAAIDRAAENFGMPIGPMELLDTIGLDVVLLTLENIHLGEDEKATEILHQLISEGHLGKKTGQGLYRYNDGIAQKPKLPNNYKAPHDLALRLVVRLANEAVACLREGIVSDADLLDAGIIFGTGFAPFRGGPIHYVQQLADDQRKEIFSRLETSMGARFKPDTGWSAMGIYPSYSKM